MDGAYAGVAQLTSYLWAADSPGLLFWLPAGEVAEDQDNQENHSNSAKHGTADVSSIPSKQEPTNQDEPDDSHLQKPPFQCPVD
jgi:hypothetical protein